NFVAPVHRHRLSGVASGTDAFFLVALGSKAEYRTLGSLLVVNDVRYEILEIKGTKVMCKGRPDAGCCIVCAVLQATHQAREACSASQFNSCITPLYSTVGWHVITVEGIGSRPKAGYHAHPEPPSRCQCGYCCHPASSCSAYSQLRDNPRPTELEVEHFFDGNICRFARLTGRSWERHEDTGACDSERSQCLDMECTAHAPPRTSAAAAVQPALWRNSHQWFGANFCARGWRAASASTNPGSLADLFAPYWAGLRSQPHRLVFGNTSAGVFKEDAASAEHLLNIRNVPEPLIRAVRRNACWAGNLMMKHAHRSSPLDVYVLLEVRFRATCAEIRTGESRDSNAHAYLNAAFSLSVDKKDGYRVTERPSLVFGGVSGKFTLEAEANPAEEACGTSPEHRRGLAANLLYKCLLSPALTPCPVLKPAAPTPLERRAQSGQQDYEEELQPAPIGRAMPKLEARAQAAGEAKYVNDAPAARSELFAAFVQAPEAPAALRDIKADEAESERGAAGQSEIRYSGQPVAIVLASSQWAADQAARLVRGGGGGKNSVIMQAPMTMLARDFDQAYDGQACQVEGQLVINEQAHFSIEDSDSLGGATEEGLVVTAPHQWVDALAMTLSRILGRPANQIRVVSPRIGGGFGGKLLMIDLVAAACAVASDSLGRPVRMYMSLGPTLALAMKRPGMLLRYPRRRWTRREAARGQLGHQQRGGLHAEHAGHMRTDKPESTFVRGPGPAPACLANLLLMDHLAFQLGVDPIEFKYRNLYSDWPGELRIDIVGNTRRGDNFQRMWRELHQAAEVEKRLAEIAEFNKGEGRGLVLKSLDHWLFLLENNRFRKRGLDMSASSYKSSTTVYLALQASDGRRVTLSHGGARWARASGQKLPRRPAAILEIDINLVKIKATDSHVLPNNEVTGAAPPASGTARPLLKRPRRSRSGCAHQGGQPGRQLEGSAEQGLTGGVSLAAMGSYYCKNARPQGEAGTAAPGSVSPRPKSTSSPARVRDPPSDLMMDVGQVAQPGVDIGQIEGAF
uniref:Ald_Xan_dh_C domain-containing protein n=1 Tax=Macrostomum lignano TaxID=282301 RepID=A0A1I8FAR3_9PLAT